MILVIIMHNGIFPGEESVQCKASRALSIFGKLFLSIYDIV